MRRLFWVALGATAGVIVVRRITRAAENFTADGAADQVSRVLNSVTDAARDFAADVRAGMAERDAELRDALGIADDGIGARGEPSLAAVEHLLDPNQRRGTF